MKKHNMMRAASALAVVTLLSTGLISGTLAKYVSETSKTSTAVTVARWEFNVKDSEESKDFTFDLFGNITDSDGGKENDVASKKIAPGTSGQVSLVLENNSEVTANYTVSFAAEQGTATIPLEYEILEGTNGTPQNWKSTLSDIDVNSTDLNAGEKKTYTVYWKWDYEKKDENQAVKVDVDTTDTKLGTAASATAQITAKVTATQAD